MWLASRAGYWFPYSKLQTLEVSRVEFKWWDAKMPPSPYLIWIKIYSHDLNLAVYSVYKLPQVPRLFSYGSSVPYYCTFKNAF